jgi:hypothetical protein
MGTLRILLNISPEEFVEWYRGTAQVVIAQSEEGLTVQFPASILQRFVTKEGVQGRFELTYDEANRFVSIDRVNPPAALDHLA